jgi:hypothetical protein
MLLCDDMAEHRDLSPSYNGAGDSAGIVSIPTFIARIIRRQFA